MNFLKTKYLTPVAFLIFFMPFLRMCESNKVIKTIEHKEENLTEVITEKRGGFYVGNEVSLNAYQIGFGVVRSVFKNEFELKYLKEKDFYATISYSIIILFSILMIIFSWKRKYLLVRNLVIINIVLLIISTILFVESKIINEFSDLKYGIYVFLIYSILVIYVSKKENLELKT